MGAATVRDDFRLGEQDELSKVVTEADVAAYAELTGDRNPVHLDAAYARGTRFGRRIAHGMLTAGLISAVLGNRLPGPGAIYLSQQLEFLAPVYLDDRIRVLVEVTAWRPDKRIVTLKTDCYNQDGVQVLAGQAVLMVPAAA